MKLVKGMLINTEKSPRGFSPYEIDEDNLDSFYDALNCRCIDIVERVIDGRTFTIVCDDEGLFKETVISAIDKNMKPVLVGNLFICHNDGPYLASLDEDDLAHISKNIIFSLQKPNGWFSPIVMNVEYF